MTRKLTHISRTSFFEVLASLLFAAMVFLFWWQVHPEALSFQEQYQLFLFNADYFLSDVRLPGGCADYVAEFLVQFYFYPAVGALILALVFLAVQRLTWRNMHASSSAYPLSFLPAVLLLWFMGDESVLLSYPISLLFCLLAAWLMDKKSPLLDIPLLPILYWAAGPMALLYVLLRIIHVGARSAWTLLWLVVIIVVAYSFVLKQWPLQSVLAGLNYYRTPLQLPALLYLVPLSVVAVVLCAQKLPSKSVAVPIAQVVLLGIIAFFAVTKGYNADKYELLKQDYLIRQEKWADLVRRADKKVVRTTFWSNAVNLALAKQRALADRMFDFYQSGPDALIMRMHRDMMSNLPTAEAFFQLGMINSAQRYYSDLQESILNGKKSGRFEQRITECLIANGQYALARKHLHLLQQSLFYRSWAQKAEAALKNERLINAHPDLGRLRKYRFKSDFLYNYEEKDKMFGQLFVGNPDNKMALDYFMAQLLLDGNVKDFMQYMYWVQQYGGYQAMPVGYQDAIKSIQSHGSDNATRYSRYVQKMLAEQQKGGSDVQAH